MTSASTTIAIADGRIRGLRRDGSTVFYGIPYAEIPIGPLAFEAPVRRAAWEGVRDATAPGATAQVQGFDGTIPEPSVPGDDILTVNVFTPDPSARASLPVLVWIHGGAYIAGSPTSPWYDGASFNRAGVVVVTVGYRLGVTGFGLVEDAPANRGLLDWLAALKWVQENIAAFGGDPARVTIAGQSAGGGAVLTLLGTPEIESLAHQAIAMSPVTGLSSTAAARGAIAEISAGLNVKPTAVALSALPREALANAPWLMRNVFGAA
ncbi:MAG: carboxylesterase family protein, partial [Microbacterium sp.]